jgi:hypothetical protein
MMPPPASSVLVASPVGALFSSSKTLDRPRGDRSANAWPTNGRADSTSIIDDARVISARLDT